MRRKDREVTDADEIAQIIEKCDVCRLAFCDKDVPYIVPMSFGCEMTAGKLTLYFHCAAQGRKIDIIRNNPNACFEMDISYKIDIGGKPGNCTAEYESIIGNGVVSIIDSADRDGKLKALKLLMKKYAGTEDLQLSEKQIGGVTMLKLPVQEYSAKRHLKRQD